MRLRILFRSLAAFRVLTGLVATVGRAEVSDARKAELNELVSDSQSDCRYLSPEENGFLREYFYDSKRISNNPDARDNQLIQVADEATIQKRIQEFETLGYFKMPVDKSGEPRFITAMAEALFREEPYVESNSDTLMPPKSYRVTYSIVKILRDSPQLSPEVRHWALGLNIDDPVNNRAILRKWWRENGAVFGDNDYKAVQPGRVQTAAYHGRKERRRPNHRIHHWGRRLPNLIRR